MTKSKHAAALTMKLNASALKLVTYPQKLSQWITSFFSHTVIRRCDIHNGDCQHDCFYDVDGVGRCKCRDGRVIDPRRESKCWSMFLCVHESYMVYFYKVLQSLTLSSLRLRGL